MPTPADTSDRATAPRRGGGAEVVTTSPDPTANVQKLVDAANLRSDDLRQAEGRRLDEANEAERRRVDDLAKHLEQMAEMRANHARELNVAETKRIDAIRSVDVAAVAIANERATAQATVLANNVATSAETLRALVATQAAATAQQFATTTTQLSERISLLERSSYEGQGRSTLADPAIARMAAELERISTVSSRDQGRGAGASQLWGYLVGAAGVVAAIAIALFK